MKQFKQFRSEQQVINEVGPIGATMMAAMGIFGGGLAAYKLFKKAKEKVKGYKETKAEKKDNKENGVFIKIKVFNSETGKEDTVTKEIAAAGSSGANMSNDERDKKQKEEQKKLDPANAKKQAEWEIKNKEKEDKEDKEKKEKEAEDKKDKEERGGIEDVKDAEEYFKNNDEAPPGWRNAGDKDKPELMTTKDYNKEMERRKRVKKKENPAQKTGGGSSTSQGRVTTSNPNLGLAGLRRNDRILSFGEFIIEDVMKDLKKATKSKKDSEITLDDGADIPIDPLTASILVKYIEGLGSSEKSKTINKIQRTERAFMKVLGQAHGE